MRYVVLASCLCLSGVVRFALANEPIRLLPPDVFPTRPGEVRRDFVVHDGLAYFAAFHPDSGIELWQTDGTPAGTHITFESLPGTESGIDDSLEENNISATATHVFSMGYTPDLGLQVWSKAPNEEFHTMLPAEFKYEIEHAGVYADDRIAMIRRGTETWISDGTVEGTHQIDLTLRHVQFARIGESDRLIMRTIPSVRVVEGTNVLPEPLLNLGPLEWSHSFTSMGDGAMFVVTDWENTPNGGVYKTDGTLAGTIRLTDRQIEGDGYLVNGRYLTIDRLIWDNGELLSFDYATGAMTTLKNGITGFAGEETNLAVNADQSLAMFVIENKIWTTDGTAQNTNQFADLGELGIMEPDGYLADIEFVNSEITLIMTFDNNSDVSTLWLTDGTVAGTQQLNSFWGPWEQPILGAKVFGSTLVYGTWDEPGAGVFALAIPEPTSATLCGLIAGISLRRYRSKRF